MLSVLNFLGFLHPNLLTFLLSTSSTKVFAIKLNKITINDKQESESIYRYSKFTGKMLND